MKSPVEMNLELVSRAIDRGYEDMVADTGMAAPIDLHPADDDAWELIEENGNEAGDALYRQMFARERAAISQFLYDTIRDGMARELGCADLTLDIEISDDDIDDLLMLALDPKLSAIAPKEETPIEEKPTDKAEVNNG